MIQRIQTVYLFIAAVLTVTAMLLPTGYFHAGTDVTTLTSFSTIAPNGTADYTSCPMFLLLLVSAIFSLVAIFQYKKRKLQIRLSMAGIVVLIGYYAVEAVMVLSILDGYGNFTPSGSVCLPLLSIILNGLAVRAIRKDEKLVRSYDTIR